MVYTDTMHEHFLELPANIKIYKTSLVHCAFGDDGILYSYSIAGERSKENYDKVFEVYKELSNNGANKLCILADISKTQPFNKEVRDYIVVHLARYVKAIALISETPVGNMIGQIFTAVSQAPFPTAIFGSQEEAVEWLKAYM